MFHQNNWICQGWEKNNSVAKVNIDGVVETELYSINPQYPITSGSIQLSFAEKEKFPQEIK